MKKILIVFILLIISVFMSACAGFESAENINGNTTEPIADNDVGEVYEYADKLEIPEDSLGVSVVRDLYMYSDEYEYDIAALKDVIREVLNGYGYLDWERFDRLSSTRTVNITEDDIPNLSQETLEISSGYAAFYDEETDSILICPAFFEYEEDQKKYTIVHEVVHSLVSKEQHKADHLDEGVVDTLALKVVNKLGIECTLGYQISILATEWLTAIFGEEQYFKAVREGVAEKLVNESTKEGLGEKLNYALILAHSEKNPSAELNVIYDILAHLAKNKGEMEKCRELLRKDDSLFSAVEISIDADYFEKLLEQ